MKFVSEIKMVSVDKLIPYARNARTHSDQQVSQIASSIKEFGFNNPILIKDDFTVIAGHGRLAAATKLGLIEVPTVSLSHLTPTQVKAYILADNKLALNAGWDEEMLALEIQELDLEGFDVSLAGFDTDEVNKLLAQSTPEGLTDEDDAPEPPEEPKTKLGDVWLLGKHRVMCGDSTMIDSVQKLMNGELADMVFTDPPYGVSYKDSLGRSIKNDELVDDKLEEFLFEAFSCAVVSTKENTAWFVWHPDRFSAEFASAMKKCNVRVRQQIIWVKGEGVEGSSKINAPQIGNSHWRFLHEPCWYGSTGTPFNLGDRKTTTVWTVTRPTRNTVHPTQKPIPLIEIAIENSSQKGNLILDLFGGSGSTLIACEKNGRINRSMELDPKYVDVIVQRWQNFTGKVATLESDESAFPIPPNPTQPK